ncbi:unnamed protein product [Acanthosepion pharaonis]|uniref:Laminin EGF-like domain-containing protein n=1 Tax=Acanthosepion pharaonis TaxID=158019 RepID=A0A812AY32_ACAPH|nr:unnamed protein product [Sepia pharaonis]
MVTRYSNSTEFFSFLFCHFFFFVLSFLFFVLSFLFFVLSFLFFVLSFLFFVLSFLFFVLSFLFFCLVFSIFLSCLFYFFVLSFLFFCLVFSIFFFLFFVFLFLSFLFFFFLVFSIFFVLSFSFFFLVFSIFFVLSFLFFSCLVFFLFFCLVFSIFLSFLFFCLFYFFVFSIFLSFLFFCLFYFFVFSIFLSFLFFSCLFFLSFCKCHLIGTRDGHTACNLDTGHPCYCNSGYGGLFCDRCQPKHYSLEGKCLPCPCTSEIGSFNCRLVNNKPVCNCLNGYAGERCNRCSNGYFKYYRTCAKCICHNNVDPLSPDICDPDIGACRHCLYNTTGFSCEDCLPGFVGDPILHKNCTKPNSSSAPKIPASHSKASLPLSLKVGLPLVILFICIIIGILILQRHRFYHKLQPFWTIELKDDHDSVTLSANDGQEFGGASLSSRAASNHDDMDFYAKHISHQGGMQYSPLRETM